MLWRGPFGQGAASGKLGALVASHNKGGQYLRARTTPTNPNTVQQQAVRNAVRTLGPRWVETLNEDQQGAWETYAANVTLPNRLGDQMHVSGLSMYIRSNVSRLQAGLDIVDDAPVIYDLGAAPAIGAISIGANELAGATGTITLAGENAWAADADNALLVYVSRPQNPTKIFFKGPYRLAGEATQVGTTSDYTFGMPFETNGSNNQNFFTMRVAYADGRLSGATSTSAFPA